MKNPLIKFHKNDTSRLRRIWEVHKYTDKTLTSWLDNKNQTFLTNQKYQVYLFNPDRKRNL